MITRCAQKRHWVSEVIQWCDMEATMTIIWKHYDDDGTAIRYVMIWWWYRTCLEWCDGGLRGACKGGWQLPPLPCHLCTTIPLHCTTGPRYRCTTIPLCHYTTVSPLPCHGETPTTNVLQCGWWYCPFDPPFQPLKKIFSADCWKGPSIFNLNLRHSE